MMLKGRPSRWPAALALGFAGLIGVGAALVLAAPARSEATAFELTFEAELEPPEFVTTKGGTFGSRAPLCAGGRIVEIDNDYVSATWRFTCDDGTGSLTIQLGPAGGWRILEGSGSYAGLRGEGSMRGELLCDPWLDASCDRGKPILWRGTLVGVVDSGGVDPETVAPTNVDTVAPTIGFSNVRVTKLPRPAGSYSLDVAIALRDDVEGNPVSYLLRVTPTASARELARSFGTTRDGTASMTMRVRYYNPPRRAVLLRLSASDEVGNESSVNRVLRLPR